MGRGYNQRRGDNRSNKQNDTPLEDRVKNKDIYMRMNFLYQSVAFIDHMQESYLLTSQTAISQSIQSIDQSFTNIDIG